MRIHLIAFSARGCQLGRRLAGALGEDAVFSAGFGGDKVSLADWTAQAFLEAEALVFIGATGIAVRAIAPHLKSKTTDPAVVVLDDRAKFCISLVSGHLGGANDLTRQLAALSDAVPVITTATDNAGVFAVDTWAKRHGLHIVNPEAIKLVSGKLLDGQCVRLRSEFPVVGKLPTGVALVSEKPYDMEITVKNRTGKALCLVPKIAHLGVGCRKNIAQQALEDAYAMLLAKGCIHEAAVAGVCSIDLKKDEAGLLAFCSDHNLPYRVFKAGQLNRAEGNFTPSAFVQKTTGTDNVCERSAVLGSGGRLILKKNAGNGVTMAMALADYTVTFEEEP